MVQVTLTVGDIIAQHYCSAEEAVQLIDKFSELDNDLYERGE